jgi:large subunit ribosomal protein L17
MFRNMVTALLRHERIETTDAKAKELRRWADRMIGLGKQGTLHARRQAHSIIRDAAVVRKLFDTLAPRFKDRRGGYTRTAKLGPRRGDNAPISIIELVQGDIAPKAEERGGAKEKASRGAGKGRSRAAKASTKQSQSTKDAAP